MYGFVRAAPAWLILVTCASCISEQPPYFLGGCDSPTVGCDGAQDCYALCVCKTGDKAECENRCGADAIPDFDAVENNWDAQWEAFELSVLELTNQQRAEGACCGKEGCFDSASPLQLDERLTLSARVHAKDMSEQGYFEHESKDGRTAFDRIRAAQFRGCFMGENIAQGQDTPESVIEEWMSSPGHCANIMASDFDSLGVGYYFNPHDQYRHTWVQDFGG